MASKRKSTIPCMIPSKIIHQSEDIEQGIPVLQRQITISGSGAHSPSGPADSPTSEAADPVTDDTGTYICKPCNFETYDLNLFLDHVYAGHPEFRSDPSFLCVSCGFSALKFEGLALHNARIHPSTFNSPLQLRKLDKRVVVEQTIVTGTDEGKDEISITKTPIMRMLKGKTEPKRIVVSHPVSDDPSPGQHSTSSPKEPERKETAVAVTQVAHVPTIVHNGTTKVTLPSAIQIVNGSGALPVLKTPITQVVSVQNKSLHQSSPIAASSDASSSKNLPKVMIPLSSIPTYNASMDSSSFLKTSFGKFPYPTKAELCYLTVVTKFPEEQIKIWFTAQRLKQGISWSPEEIEEARRKMFNTIIHTASTGTQNRSQSRPSPAQPTITLLGATGIPQILQGSLVSPGGVIVTQPVVANGIQVSSAPVALAVTPKPQAAAKPMMQARPAAALVADKGTSMILGAVASSSTGSNVISSSKSSRSGGGAASSIISSSQASIINLTLGSNNHSNAKVSNVSTKHNSAHGRSNSNISSHAYTAQGSTDAKNPHVSKTTNTGTVQSDSKVVTDIKKLTDSKPSSSGNTTDNSGQKSTDVNGSDNKNDTSSTRADDLDPSTSDSFRMDEASSPSSKSSSPSPAAGASSACLSSRSISAFLDPTFYKGKKSQEQLNTLKDSFLSNQYPDQEEVDRLISLTGLTVREVRKWFSDRRYHFRNLKGPRSSTGAANKSSAGSGVSGGGDAGSTSPMDLSETSSSGAKTPQHSSAPLSPASSMHTPTSPTTPSRRLPRSPSPDFTAVRYKEREPHQIKALEASFAQEPEPLPEEVDRLRCETKMTRREIHNWFTERRKKAAAAEKRKEEAERALRGNEEGEQMEIDGEERLNDDASGELKVNPIKINLKMLKVTESNGKSEGEVLDCPTLTVQSSTSINPMPTLTPKPSHSPKPPVLRGKKTAEQLHLLKQVYARTQWPSAAQYDELLSGTGLPRPDVVRWFGDCRYMQKNSQLKWLEAYQNMALEEDLQKDNAHVLQAHLDVNGSQEESQLQELTKATGLTTDLVRHWFATRASVAQREPTSAVKPTLSGAAQPPSSAGSSPLEPHPRGGRNEKIEQSLCGTASQAEEGNTDKTVSPTEGAD
ncbi:zinc fingers and homeoboxes protein 3 [Dunckerocampus dactyliophorus]|uniref:zinc fingers and homeoboxes protein 3 n=1 Tax=Dunckerocampus dactyliophorus TaxID=161453 RepID=UPI002406825A|nr:zinc fingers and homeoboxes protein 3 [Dunckerocampus dactyliophorus]